MPTVRTQQAQGAGGGGGGSQQGGSGGGAGGGGGGGAQRTNFRPPWIKEGPNPLPMPAAPWTLARAKDRRTSREESAPEPAPAPTPVRKQSKVTIIPSQPSQPSQPPQQQPQQENGVDARGLKRDVINAASAKKTQPEPAKEAPPERKMNIQVESKQRPPAGKDSKDRNAGKTEAKKEAKTEPPKAPPPPPQPARKSPPRDASPRPKPPEPTPLSRSRSSRTNLAPPKPPPLPPAMPPTDFQKDPLPAARAAKLEALRTGRSRKRPDWGAMMKEVEHGLKLKKVQCNDRSAPLLSASKVKGQFMYESEKPNVHNLLLREIQGGVKLKRVQCNDRSKPVLEGLRKFRRQMTIEEQQQQQQQQAAAAAEEEVEELDDIDSLRDDLQSTKQMLALELRNKEAVEKENKRLQARILNLELELEEERKRKAAAAGAAESEARRSDDQKKAEALREQLSGEQKRSHELEQKVHEADLQADLLRAEMDELRRRNATLERKLDNAAKEQPLTKQPSAKRLARSSSNMAGPGNDAAGSTPQAQAQDEDEDEEEEEEEEETESEEEDSSEDEEKMAALREKRQLRELKLLSTKVRTLKEKQETVRMERRALRISLRNQTQGLALEKKKFRKLQKEVDKMARLMKEDDDEDEAKEDEAEEEEEEEEEESEEESSTEESEDDESEGELPETAAFDDRKKNYTERAKRHENILAALKKGNYLLKANVEKMKDDLFKQREMSLSLQEELNAVLEELG